jgi:hypothetical protein
MSRQPPGLVARIRSMRRAAASAAQAAGDPRTADRAATPPEQAAELRARVAHLEQLVQGLQDSVYREVQRLDKRVTEIERRIEPAELASALSKDARERGL